MRMTIFFMLIMFFSQNNKAPAHSARDLAILFEQNKNTFVIFEVDTSWSQNLSDQYRTMMQKQISFFERLSFESLSDSKLKQLKALAPPGTNLRNFFKQFAEQKQADLKLLLGAPASNCDQKYFISPDLIEICEKQPADDPRTKNAQKKSLKSFTDSDYFKAQMRSGNGWTALDPYPIVGSKTPLIWKTEKLKIRGMLPLFVSDLQITTEIANPVHSFWATPTGIVSFSSWSQGEQKVELLAKPLDEKYFLLSAVLPDKGALPLWIAKFSLIDMTFDKLDVSMVQKLAQQVETLHIEQIDDLLSFASPMELFYCDLIEKINGAGWYAKKMTHVQLGTMYEYEGSTLGDWRKLPVGWVKDGVLKVTSIEANSPEEPSPLPMVDGTTVLNLDTKQTFVVGADTEKSLKQLIDQPTNIKLWLLFVINFVVLMIIAFCYWYRRRAKK